MKKEIEKSLPKHIGIIVDGNRRWARERGLATLEGHRRGLKKVEMVIDELVKKEVKYISLYLFSTENWNRSREEVDYLMRLAKEKLAGLMRKLGEQGLKVVVMGRPEPVEPELWQNLTMEAEKTAGNSRGVVALCFNYGGQQEIIDGILKIPKEELAGLTVEKFGQYLYHPEVPPVDLVVRTSGEERISGFMLWRVAYAEFLFLSKYFPDLAVEDVEGILKEFQRRQRRFGR